MSLGASPSPLVPALLRHVAERGRDAAELATRFGLPVDACARDELAVAPAMLGELIEAAARLLGEPALALQLPELPARRYGVVELAMRASATAGEALRQAVRYGRLIHPLLESELVVDGDEARWHQRTPGYPRGLGRYVHEYGLAFVVHQLRAVTTEMPALTRVWFAHPRPPDLAPIERWAGSDRVAFGADDSGFAFASLALDGPVRTADPRMLATVEDLAADALRAAPDGPAIVPRVVAVIRARLPDEVAMADVAEALRTSTRTLQRRLLQEGSSFSGVVDRTREALARELLADLSLPLGEVAYRVGFSDLATFSRAFKRWTGKPPGLFRRS